MGVSFQNPHMLTSLHGTAVMPFTRLWRVKFIPGQPQKGLFVVALAFPACPVEFPEGNPIQQGLSRGTN
jgi:hypothetical protein